MSLNPLSSNYLKSYTFGAGRRQKSVTPTKIKQKIEKNKTNIKQISVPKAPDNLYNLDSPLDISATFQLNNFRLTSHFFLTIEGYLFSYIKKQGNIYGRACIIFPEAIIASVNVIHGKINGWAVICKRDAFYNICQFKGGVLDGYQYTYDIICGLMLQTQYRYGKLKSIKKCTVQSMKSFEKQINNKAALAMLQQTLNNEFFSNYFPRCESKLGNYYGQVTENIPIGLGVLITDCQIFYGQFERGLLSGVGVISMENGNYYFGQMQKGLARGMSMNLNNGTLIYKLYQIQVNQQKFKSRMKLSSFNDIFQLKNVFRQIVNIYLTLRQIYLKKMVDKHDSEVSFVDIKGVNQQQDAIYQGENSTDRKYSGKDSYSASQTQKKDQFVYIQPQNDQFNIVLNGYQPINEEKIPEFFNNKTNKEVRKRKVSDTIRESQMQRQNIQKTKKQQGKHKRRDKVSRKSKPILTSEKQWNEIIQELDGQESVGRQDGFYEPTKQVVKDNESGELQLKLNTFKNSNQRMIKLQPQTIIDQQKQQSKINRVIGKLTLKK